MPADFLPLTPEEVRRRGWDAVDVVLVTGDAYVDHPSFAMALLGRVLEAEGLRVAILAQPRWDSAADFRKFGRPRLFFGVSAGNMDSMINKYTHNRKVRSSDDFSPGGRAGLRPDRATIIYSQRCREACPDAPVVIGGIEATMRRFAHYDYWSDKVRRSILLDSKADLLIYGNAERALVEIAHRLARREPVGQITDVRGTAFVRRTAAPGWREIDSTEVDRPGRVDALSSPYQTTAERAAAQGSHCDATKTEAAGADPTSAAAQKGLEKPIALIRPDHARSVIRLPSYEQVRRDPVLYAHANRVLHLETNPGNARALVQAHGEGRSARDVWINPPPVPLTSAEMDHIFDLPYARNPHPRYADERGRHDGATRIPAWEMIRFSVNIMRGCFGGCTFCSITEHEGRIIQSRSEDSIVREVEAMRDKVQGFTGVVSDLGGPTANMYRLGCRDPAIEAVCRKPSCVYPGICPNLRTDHDPLIRVYRRVRQLPGVKKVLIGSGLRYDLAVRSPAYVKELVQHHVGGYLKIAPEHTEQGPLSKMMKPGIGDYERFRQLFDRFSAEAGKQQYLIPYFIAAHPGTSDQDMLQLALWLKRNGFRADQVQAFYPSPMATATTMYHTGVNPLKGVHRDGRGERVDTVKGERRRRLHKAFLRWHDPANWPLLRQALKDMGRHDLIGSGKHHLIPAWQPAGSPAYQSPRRKNSSPAASPRKLQKQELPARTQPAPGRILTQHTGLPPRRST